MFFQKNFFFCLLLLKKEKSFMTEEQIENLGAMDTNNK
jgi:hypothetical protein